MHQDTPSVRERLLEAGVAVLSRAGFNGSSVQDITEAAGVPKGSFYNHFDSKEALGAAAVEYFWGQKASQSLAILDDETIPPLEGLRTYFERIMMEMEAKGFTCGCFIGNMTAELSDHSSVISHQLSTIYQRWTGHVSGCIARAQKAGAIRSDASPDVLAAFTLNAWEGAMLRARAEKRRLPMQQFLDTLFSQLLR